MVILISSIISSSGAVQSDGVSDHFAGAGEIHSSSIHEYWKTIGPTYAMNWGQPQGPMADLANSNFLGLSGENDLLASWAAASGPFEVDQFARSNKFSSSRRIRAQSEGGALLILPETFSSQ